MKYAAFFVVAVAALIPLWGDEEPPAKPVPMKTLRKSEHREAKKARDEADLRLDAVEKQMLESRRAANRLRFTEEELKRFASEIEDVEKGFQAAIDRYPHTEIACYCAQRIAGFYQFRGKFDDAVRLMQETAIEYAGTPEEPQLLFSIGLMEAQARDNQAEAIRWFSKVPRPNTPVVERRGVNPLALPERHQLFLSAQQQIVKAALKLRLNEQARQRLDFLKEAFPKRVAELDRFYEFEQKSIATGGSTSPSPEGFTLPKIAEEKPQPPPTDAETLQRDVSQLGRLKHGPAQDAAIAALAGQGDAAVAEIERQVGDETPDFGMVHSSVRTLKAINSEKSRDLLYRIARGDFRLENPNLEPWAAGNLISLDKNVGWGLLVSTNQGVLTAAMNAVEGQPIDEERLVSLKNCLKHKHDLVRWRAAEVLATAPRGKLADEAFEAISQALIAVADLADLDKLDPKSPLASLNHTLGEANYIRFSNALMKVQVDDQALHKLAKQHEGRTRDAVILALGHRGDRSVHDQIIKLAQDPEASLFRAWAVNTLRRIGTPKDIPLLKKLSETDPLLRSSGEGDRSYPVRNAAKDAIRTIENMQKAAKTPGAT